MRLLPIFLCAVCLAGCQSDKVHSVLRAKAQKPTTFLPCREKLVKQPDTFPFHYFYLKPNIGTYERVYIAPVNTEHLRKSNAWVELDKQMSGKLGHDISALATYMRDAYTAAFKTNEKALKTHHLAVVDSPRQPKTLVVETAIVAFAPTKAELSAAGLAASFVVPVIGTVAAAIFAPGSITVECRVRDAATGEIVAAYSNTERDPNALISTTSFTWTYSARVNIKTMAFQTAKVLSAKDYRKIRRDFPVQFTSLVNDSNLKDDKASAKTSAAKTTTKKKGTKK